jgi:hypothetical protein
MNRTSSTSGPIMRNARYPYRSQTEGKAFRISNGPYRQLWALGARRSAGAKAKTRSSAVVGAERRAPSAQSREEGRRA